MIRYGIAVGCIGGILFFHAIGVLAPVERAVLRSVSAVLQEGASIRTALGFGSTRDEAEQLRARVAELEVRAAQGEEARIQNASLKKLIAYRDAHPITFTPARVLGRSTDPERSLIVIDIGADDNIEKGSAVIVDDGVLVGTIDRVERSRSFVMLLNDNRSTIIAAFASAERPRGIITGQFQLGLKMDLIPITEKIAKDTLLVTSGTEQGIPAGLVVGRVAEIQSKPTDIFQSARITPSVQYDDLHFVAVLKK